ncbi:MAG: DUF3014 domain-containing protein [Thermoanaerobaculia bacterium]
MDRLDDEPLERASYQPPAPHSSRAVALPLTIAAALVLAGAGYWLWRSPPAPPPAGAAPAAAAPAAAAPAPAAAPLPPLPRLDASDGVARDLVGSLSTRPELARWLAGGEGLIRAAVGATIRLGEGNSPRASIPFWAPPGRFAVTARAGRTYVDPETYDRYAPLVDLFAEIDADRLAAVVRRLTPLLDEATAEVSLPGRRFATVLAAAIDELGRTPLPADGEALEVTGGGGLYRYADPDRENLSAAQKQLLRLGPRNARRVLAKLDALSRALGL